VCIAFVNQHKQRLIDLLVNTTVWSHLTITETINRSDSKSPTIGDYRNQLIKIIQK